MSILKSFFSKFQVHSKSFWTLNGVQICTYVYKKYSWNVRLASHCCTDYLLLCVFTWSSFKTNFLTAFKSHSSQAQVKYRFLQFKSVQFLSPVYSCGWKQDNNNLPFWGWVVQKQIVVQLCSVACSWLHKRKKRLILTLFTSVSSEMVGLKALHS